MEKAEALGARSGMASEDSSFFDAEGARRHETPVPGSGVRRRASFVPCVRLFADEVIDERGVPTRLPVCTLSFEYDGVRVRGQDERGGGFRDHAGERDARRILEGMGALDLSCLDLAASPEADYLLRVDVDEHAFVSFAVSAVPRLRSAGFRVELDEAYPWDAIDPDRPIEIGVSSVTRPDKAKSLGPREKDDWFQLELGLEVDGRKVDLLALVMGLLDEAADEDDLGALERRAMTALRVSPTKSFVLSGERMRALFRVVVELHQGVRSKRIFPAARAALVADLERDLVAAGAKTELRDPKKVVARAKAIRQPPRPIEVVPSVRATLRPYQKEGVAFLQHLARVEAGGILADDMGLGKTLQTICHLALEKAKGALTAPALIVCPTSLSGNWRREIEKFAPHLSVLSITGPRRSALYFEAPRYDVVVTTYPILARDEERFAPIEFHLAVLDEAQAIKNVRSLAAKNVRALRVRHRLCLSGTPIENNLGELFALFDFLNPGLLGDEASFRSMYRAPIEDGADEERLASLRDLVRPYMLRRMKRDVAKDLPPKSDLARPVELSGAQRDLYESIRVAAHAEVRKAIKSKGLAASALPILDALMKLRQVCCDPRLVPLEAARGVTESAKLDALDSLLGDALSAGHRVLVFSQFTSMLALISARLREADVDHLVLTGDTKDRQKLVDAFENREADVMLISLKAGGTGLNLVSADTVVHYDPWWNPAAQAQASDRAYRIGQKKPVMVYNLFAVGSVEERVLRLQERKRTLADSILADAAPLKMHESDVHDLFAPLE